MATPTPEVAIWLALKARLDALTLSPALQIDYPNEHFTPPAGENYLSANILRNDPSFATMGSTGKTRHRGIFQIFLYAKKDQNFAVASEIAGDIAKHFEPPLDLTNNGYTVRVDRPPTVGSDISRAEDPKMRIPISIRYSADANRS
ncbi:hypothetical protein MXMO3_01823 [Maritalea myrionectae]|uniref:Tail terminator n=1 Tax=Maritalea myrionectae TaxID=454601 RepID=A0A2R4ME81_9HYPH|nr:phage tail terminator-like protein [Maritalea myrionectae]AVX04348.1 hypothetical protein MXMO3_01823 [Maritalea myrionectae]